MLHLGAADALIHIIICALRDEGEIFVCQVLNLNAEEVFFPMDSVLICSINHRLRT